MLNRDQRLFLSSFLITLLLCGWLALFLAVDSSNSQNANGAVPRALAVNRADELNYELSLLGQEYAVSFEELNRLESKRKQYACLVTPRPVLVAEQLYGLAAYGYRYYYDMYKEWQYQQNIAKEPQT